MKLLIKLAFTMILAFVLAQFMPFWSVALAAFIVAFVANSSPGRSFLAGFFSIALLWLLSAWIISDVNNHILIERVAGIFTLHPILLVVVMAVIGGLLGGFAAAAGSQLGGIVFERHRSNNPYRM